MSYNATLITLLLGNLFWICVVVALLIKLRVVRTALRSTSRLRMQAMDELVRVTALLNAMQARVPRPKAAE